MPRKHPALSEAQLEVLRALSATVWRTPYMLGGSDNSYHAKVLPRLVARGLVETQKAHTLYCGLGLTDGYDRDVKGCTCRGSRRYRLAPGAVVPKK